MRRLPEGPPNIVVLHCHDLGRFLGAYGVQTVRSPHLDGLAADGVTFTRAFCTAPQCSPSRASLFTGRYPHSTGVLGLTHGNFAWDLHDDERHLAAELRDNGYTTTLLGVHHESRTGPADRVAARLGFDQVVLGGLADTVAGRANEQLDRLAGSDRPFYLQVGFVEPHRMPGPHDPPGTMGFLGDHLDPDTDRGLTVPGYLMDTEGTRTEIAELQGAVRHMDAAVGRILGRLGELGLEHDTVVVFTTDHGLALPRAKCSLFDPGLEVALLIRFPARGWVGGWKTGQLVSNVDVTPTLLEAAGIAIPKRVQGRSLAGLLDGGTYVARTEIFGEMTYHDYYDPRRCIRTETHKLIVNFTAAPDFMDPSQSWRPRSMAQAPRPGWRRYHGPVELYDLAKDPYELNDIADDPAHADLRRSLLARVYAWMAETRDPLLDGAVTSPLHHRAMGELAEAAHRPAPASGPWPVPASVPGNS